MKTLTKHIKLEAQVSFPLTQRADKITVFQKEERRALAKNTYLWNLCDAIVVNELIWGAEEQKHGILQLIIVSSRLSSAQSFQKSDKIINYSEINIIRFSCTRRNVDLEAE